MKALLASAISLVLSLSIPPAAAAGLEVQPLGQGLWALVGETGQRSPDNLANNATFGVIDTQDGLVLVDPGGSYLGAQQIETAIHGFSTKPVVLVINTGGQDHRWLGNGYWRGKGARIIASAAAVADQQARQQDQFFVLYNLVGEAGMKGTEAVFADQTFAGHKTLTLGGRTLELHHYGAAHTPGDTVVWLPRERVLFTGDTVFLERMLGVGPQSDLKSWIKVFDQISQLPAKTVVPGHGHPGSLKEAEAQTGHYLKTLRDRVSRFIEDGGTLDGIHRVDQREFMDLENAGQLAGRNAHQAFQQLEFDF